MKKITRIKTLIVVVLALVMSFAMFQIAFAAEQLNFPLNALNGDLVADENTQYIAHFEQDPVSKFITASIQVYHGTTSPTAKPLVISGISFELSFDNRIAPYRYNPETDLNNHPYDATRMYQGGLNLSDAAIKNYLYTPIAKFDVVGSNAFQNDTTKRFIGATITSATDTDVIVVNPGQTKTVAQLFFMPTSSTSNNILSLDMFNFEFLNNTNAPGLRLIRLSPWLGNGTYFLVGDSRSTNVTDTYIKNKQITAGSVSQSFKIHMAQSAPAVTASMDPRQITGYDPSTMVWCLTETGSYQTGAPVIPDEACTIYVKYAATSYSGSDTVYWNYKRFLESAAVPVAFGATKDPVIPEITKTPTNLTSTDGKTHADDRLLYTIVVKNTGTVRSLWVNATLTDNLPSQVTLVPGTVKIDGVTAANNLVGLVLGDIAGGSQKTVTFEVTVNHNAAGLSFRNGVAVTGLDGTGGDPKKEEAEEDGDHNVVPRSAQPTIEEINQADPTVGGTGVSGATIEVTFPNGSKGTATVAPDGTWTVNVPTGVTLLEDQTVTAVQTEPGKDPSDPVNAKVLGPIAPDKETKKTSANLTRQDGTRRVGDTLQYTITAKNAGPAKSVWANVIVEDVLPIEVDYVANSVKIDGVAAGAAATYAAGKLTVNLGNIASGITKTVTFEAIINDNAYDNPVFKNTATVDGIETEEDDDPPPVMRRSVPPTIDVINEGDRNVEGTGVAGATVVVSFPNSTLTRTVTVGADGTWKVDVPSNINLFEDDVVKAVQTETGFNPSVPAERVVIGRMGVDPNSTKHPENLTSTDGKTHVGDKIRYTITLRNDGSPKSTWTNVIFNDTIPDGLILDTNSVRLNNAVPTFMSFQGGILQVTLLSGIVGGTSQTITFECTVAPDAFGKDITNAALITGKENGGDPKDEEIEDDDGGTTVMDKSKLPEVNPITRGDDSITGKGEEEGAEITVKLPDGTEIKTTVKPDKTWEAKLPPGKELNTDDKVKVTQTESGKDPSDPVEVTVMDKNARAVHGFVFPMVDVDPTNGEVAGFFDKHAITVELRPTFLTPAEAKLSTKATLVAKAEPTDLSKGEFTIYNVPFGTYVLHISRPGFLTRAMMVTVSASSPDMIELVPPGALDAGIFNLWWGDCNGDLIIENRDTMMIMELMDLKIDVYDTLGRYNAACDMNADGAVDGKDIMMVIERWGAVIYDYAGAELIDIFN